MYVTLHDFSFPRCDIPSAQFSTISFNLNTSLRAIYLGFSVASVGTLCITQTLLSICSSTVHTLVITLYCYPTNSALVVSEINWDPIDDVLSRPMFCSLKTVQIRAEGVGYVGRPLFAPQLPAPQLPRCHARGILRFGEGDKFGYPDFLLMQ